MFNTVAADGPHLVLIRTVPLIGMPNKAEYKLVKPFKVDKEKHWANNN